ncbi:MAG: hypothetical protein ACI9WS_000110 [Paraglaciecola psychrophila]|jgi:hypothetical protein
MEITGAERIPARAVWKQNMDIITSKNGFYELHSHYIIARFNQGSDIGFTEAVFLKALLAECFRGEFGLVIDRVNSYSFDPMVVSPLLEDLHPLKGIATVNYRRSSARSTDLLRQFIPPGLPLQSFATLADAVDWLSLPRSGCEPAKSTVAAMLRSKACMPSPRHGFRWR